MLTFMGNIVTYINCAMNKRLQRSWLKITGVFTFTIGTGTTLTLRLLMSYIYGAPSKARNANVVYIWTYVWQH